MRNIVCLDDDNVGNQLTRIALVLPELKAKVNEIILIKKPLAKEILLYQQIVTHGMKVARELRLWDFRYSNAIPYTTISKTMYEQDLGNAMNIDHYAYEDTIHVYSDLASAALWNLFRVIRIHLYRALQTIIEWKRDISFNIESPDPNSISTELQSAIKGIISSVPFHLGNTEQNACLSFHFPGQTQGYVTVPVVEELRIKAAGSLIVPLYTCLIARCLTHHQRSWIELQIRRITAPAQPNGASPAEMSTRLRDLPFSVFTRAITLKAGVDASQASSSCYNLTGPERSVAFMCLDLGCCGAMFGSHSSLKRHQREQHGDPGQHSATCEGCGNSFSRFDSLQTHLNLGRCTS